MKSMMIILASALLASGADKPEKGEKLEKRALAILATTQGSSQVLTSKQPPKSGAPRGASSNTDSLTVFDTWTNFTVPANSGLKLTSTSDYTGASQVAVAIECPNSISLKNAGLAIWWGTQYAPNMTLTDLIAGSDFVLSYMGGGTTQTYGTQIMIQVVNAGTTAVTCDQVTTYAVVH
jgi:hypothetical protein